MLSTFPIKERTVLNLDNYLQVLIITFNFLHTFNVDTMQRQLILQKNYQPMECSLPSLLYTFGILKIHNLMVTLRTAIKL